MPGALYRAPLLAESLSLAGSCKPRLIGIILRHSEEVEKKEQRNQEVQGVVIQ